MFLEVKDLSVKLRRRIILDNISFFIDSPGIYFILGKNGSGKSTLLQAIARLIPYSGTVKVLGKDSRSLKRKELAKLLGYVWQNPFHGFFESTVRREISFILKNTEIDDGKRIENFAGIFGVKKFLDRSPFTLSGGEAKRVSLASVLVADQPILLLDEPESEMDLDGINRLINYLVDNAKRKVIIVATHNTFLAIKMRKNISRIFLLKDGRMQGEYGPDVLDMHDVLEDIGIVSLRWLNEFA